ncbi:hypothetical protein ACJX0J_033370, partial [Zea mays]
VQYHCLYNIIRTPLKVKVFLYEAQLDINHTTSLFLMQIHVLGALMGAPTTVCLASDYLILLDYMFYMEQNEYVFQAKNCCTHNKKRIYPNLIDLNLAYSYLDLGGYERSKCQT